VAGLGRPELWLELEQEGPRAKGSVRSSTGTSQILPLNGLVEGTIAGDVFSFRQTDGPGRGELAVRGDEMTGEVAIGQSVPMILRRVER